MYMKAVDEDLMSLGLKRAKPIQYVIGEWVYPREIPSGDPNRGGGLWVAKNMKFVSWLRKYLLNKYGRSMRLFACEIGDILYESVNMIKTDRVKVLEELVDGRKERE